MERHPRRVRAWPVVLGLLVGAALTGCLDGRIMDGEAPTFAGLPAGEGWVALPVGLWMTEGDVEALAVMACLERVCPHRAAVGLFRARGAEAARLASLGRDPARLEALLVRASDGGKEAGRPRAPARISTEARPDGTGFALRMRSADGRRAVSSEVRLRPEGSHTLVLIAIGDDGAFVKDVVGRAQASWSAGR